MKKTLRLMSILLVVVCTLCTTVFAGPAFTPDSLTGSQTGADTEIQSFANKIIGLISTIGIVLSVVVLSILGVKYMLGSAEEKAEYKKTLMPYIIGCVLVFGASGIANMVYNFAK